MLQDLENASRTSVRRLRVEARVVPAHEAEGGAMTGSFPRNELDQALEAAPYDFAIVSWLELGIRWRAALRTTRGCCGRSSGQARE